MSLDAGRRGKGGKNGVVQKWDWYRFQVPLLRTEIRQPQGLMNLAQAAIKFAQAVIKFRLAQAVIRFAQGLLKLARGLLMLAQGCSATSQAADSALTLHPVTLARKQKWTMYEISFSNVTQE
jgi:hypothetical protein